MVKKIKYKIKRIKARMDIAINHELGYDKNFEKISKVKKIKLLFKVAIKNPKKILYNLIGKELNINYIEIVLTTKCTLNCIGCSALMGYYKNSTHTDVEKNIKALQRVMDSIDSLEQLRLLGGEPLCYPNLYEILVFANQQNKIKRVTIVTNGTLLISDKRVIDILKNNKFDVFISNYGELSRKKEELVKIFKENNIKYELRNEDSLWKDYGDFKNRNRGESILTKQFLNCPNKYHTMLNGKLHYCPRSLHGTNLNKFPLRKIDYVDVLDESLTIKQLRRNLYKFFYGYKTHIEACNHCNSATSELKTIKAGVQCKKSEIFKTIN